MVISPFNIRDWYYIFILKTTFLFFSYSKETLFLHFINCFFKATMFIII